MVKKAKATPTSYAFGTRQLGSPATTKIRIERDALLDNGDLQTISIKSGSAPDFVLDPDSEDPADFDGSKFYLRYCEQWHSGNLNGPQPRKKFGWCLAGAEWYISGGITEVDGVDVYLKDVWKTGDGKTWTLVTDDFTGGAGNGRGAHAMFYVAATDKLVICGGTDGTTVYDEIWTGTGGGNTWALSASVLLRDTCRMGYAQNPAGTELMIVGGHTGAAYITQGAISADGESWSAIFPVLATATADCSLCFIDDGAGNQYFVVGFGETAPGTVVGTMFYATTAAIVWTDLANLPLPRGDGMVGVAIFSIDSTLFVHGGTSFADSATATKQKMYITLDLGSTAWITLATVTVQRAYHAMVCTDTRNGDLITFFGIGAVGGPNTGTV